MVEGLSEELKKHGHEVYSFLQSGSNRLDGQSIVDELKMFSDAMRSWQSNPDIKRIFDSELESLKQSDAVLLLEPAGHSSLIETGIGYGMGKRVFAIGSVEKPEVFYMIYESMYPDVLSFLNDLERIAPKGA